MKLHERFKRRVAEAMEMEEINQAELARRMRVTPQMVSKYLRDDAPCPSLDVVEAFANALNIDDGAMLVGGEKIYHTIC